MKGLYRFVCFMLTFLLLCTLFGCEKKEPELPLPSRTAEELFFSEAEPLLTEIPSHSEDETESIPPEESTPEEESPTEEEREEQTAASPVKEEPETPLYTPPVSDYTRYQAVCASANVNVRGGSGTNYAVVGSLDAGHSLPYLWQQGEWYAVWLEDRVGYVSHAYSYLAETSLAIERILDAGLKKLGTPYVWGAARLIDGEGKVSPYFTGKSFDCSSFVQYCFYMGDGVKLGNYTGSQADFTVGKVITRYADLRRGDFYFTGNGSISHVVIYMGGGYLLQAYSANDGPVSFTSDARWKGKFISGRRVDLSVKEQFR